MIVIGEKINATRKSIARAITEKNSWAIKNQIKSQDEGGAHYIDLNAGIGGGDLEKEVSDMNWLIDIALECTEKKICIDSSSPEVIRRSVEYLSGRRPWMGNSLKNSPAILESMLPVIKEHGVPVVALAMGDEGIPGEVDGRLASCHAICAAAEKAGIKREQLYFDPLIMPLSTDYTHSGKALDTLGRIKRELPGVNTVIGMSNISFGLPGRQRINQAFLIATMAVGLDATICDPTSLHIREGLVLGKLISGRDRHCRSYSRAIRNGLFAKAEG